MNELLDLIPPLAAGVVLGAIFFGGLWWTIRQGLSSQRPALLFLASMLLRSSLAVSGFYFVARGHWEKLLACLLGFLMARLIVTLLTRTPNQTHPAQEANHAP